jgi:hypothetical protein
LLGNPDRVRSVSILGNWRHAVRMIVASLLSLVSVVSAHAGTIDRVDITDAGLYETKIEKAETAPGTATETRNALARTELLQKATRIDAKIGTHFGFRYRIIGQPDNGEADITFVTVPPAPGLRNPKTGKVSTREEYSAAVMFNETGYAGYSFDEDWEIVPGTWTFELWDRERKLASQRFEIVKP